MLGQRGHREGLAIKMEEVSGEENRGQQQPRAKERWQKRGQEATASAGPVSPESQFSGLAGRDFRGLTVARCVRQVFSPSPLQQRRQAQSGQAQHPGAHSQEVHGHPHMPVSPESPSRPQPQAAFSSVS